MSRLKKQFIEEQAPKLMHELGLKNVERIPRLEKIVVNVGEGELHSNKPLHEAMMRDLGRITGQRAVSTVAKKAISTFKIREGNIVGMRVTLRGARMYDFLDKLINITVPRIRDFRGFSIKSFDGHGNYSFGLKEQTVFTEIPYEGVNRTHGLQITISTTARNDEEAKALMDVFHFPFAKSAPER